LTGLARDCNELLDWLNQNPPSGAHTGNDVHELAHHAEAGRAPAEERAP
jgi:hypothetical protein